MKKTLITLLAACAATIIQAATVGYWQFDDDGGLANGLKASVGGATYDLSQTGSTGVGASGLKFGSPVPNPDASPAFIGGASVASNNTGSAQLGGGVDTYMYTDAGDDALDLHENSWTLEGWFKLDALPGGVDTMFNTRHASSGVGILLDLRNGTSSNALVNLYAKDGDSVVSTTAFADGEILVGTWHHYALTYTNGSFGFFLDGTSKGTLGTSGMNLAGLDSADLGSLQIMGRSASPDSSLNGRIDEWRISDQVLGANDFMYREPEPAETTTVAYWQFDNDGGLSNLVTSASVGDTNLYNLSQYTNQQSVGASGLFAGSPVPNPDASPAFIGGSATASNNTGSAQLPAAASTYMWTDAGDEALALSGNSWTIEGWFELDAAPGLDTLFNTRDDATGVGILLSLRDETGGGGGALANLYVKDSAGVADWVEFADGEILVGTSPRTWYHYALTFDGSQFEFFLDGISKGTLGTAGMNLAGLDSLDGDYLQIMGRSASSTSSLNGRIDEWRISTGVLASDQFLNEEGLTVGDIAIEPLSGTNAVALTWDTVPGFSYTFISKTDLAIGSWTTNTPWIDGTGGDVTVTDAVDQVQTFYRAIGE